MKIEHWSLLMRQSETANTDKTKIQKWKSNASVFTYRNVLINSK